MFDQIMKLLGKLSQPDFEQAQVVQSPLEVENKESVTDEIEQKNVVDCQDQKQSSKVAIASLQQQLNTLQNEATLSLWPPNGEYQGPIIIDHPLTLDGQGATIWSLSGPVLSIQSDRVILKNLRIEATGCEGWSSQHDTCAILVNSSSENLEFHNVEVRGTTMGLPEEEGVWKYPNSLTLEKLAPHTEYNFRLRILVPVACQIKSQISGIELTPHNLNPGDNEIQLHIEELLPSTYIHGNILIVSASLKRRITITAQVDSVTNGKILSVQNSIVWQPEDCDPLVEDQTIVECPENQPSIQSETAPQIEEPIQIQESIKSNIRRDIKPNQQIFSSVSGNDTSPAPLTPDFRITKQSKLGSAFISSTSNSESQETTSKQDQLSAPIPSKIQSSKSPNPIFNNKVMPISSNPSGNENLESQEDANAASCQQKPAINPIFDYNQPPN